ncbi:MAG TPA: type II and III secretion system protein, partial [candidate division Zixibacteria bacterium]|nr:type II and III secretion system protein [candidate division Zixibacteria bacterium]
QIDIVSPQVTIECLVVELSKRSTLELGFKGGYFKPDTTRLIFPRFTQNYDGNDLNNALDEIAGRLRMGSLGKLPADFMLTIDALEVAGKAKVRARPRITTLNGNQANINVGWIRYYQTSSQTPQGTITQLHSIDAGITLEIVPWVAASGEITTEIRPTVSNLSGIGAGGLPEISRRTVNTTIRLRDGESIVIGGLIQKSSASSKEKIPFLGDIPFLGTLFSKTSSTSDESELVIYITPHILGGE